MLEFPIFLEGIVFELVTVLAYPTRGFESREAPPSPIVKFLIAFLHF